METVKLRSLIAAYDFGSLSGAARRLGAQLSTVSRHIADVEAEVGCPLLIRTGRGVRPTREGELFVERARIGLQELESAFTSARSSDAGPISALRLSTPVEMALSLMPDCIVQMRERHPDLQIDLHSAVRRVSLLEEDFHAALRLGPPKDADHIARLMGHVRMLLCAAPSSPAHAAGADLAALPFVGVAAARGSTRLRSVSLQLDLPVMSTLRVGTFTEAAEVALRSDLLVLLPTYTAERYLDTGSLAEVVGPFDLAQIEVNLLLPRRLKEAQVLKDLGEITREKLSALNRRFSPAYST